MHVSALVWAITLVTMIVIFAVDLLIVGRRPHEPSMRESAIWVGVYVALAIVFGVVLLAAYGPRYGGEFFAGWLTEYSLSVDNLFVFVIIMGRFAVPRMLQQKVLLIGVLRTATQRVAPQGVEFVSATTEASAKAMVVSNGYLIDAFHKTVTRAQVSALGAVSSSVDAIAADFASTLAWKIPSLLTARPRVTHLVVDNVSFRLAERLKAGLETMQGIDAVRFAAVPTATRRTADLELLSGYVMVPQDELVNHCIESVGPMRIRSADKYTVSLTLM